MRVRDMLAAIAALPSVLNRTETIAALTGRTAASAHVRMAFGDAHFSRGDYREALLHYKAVETGPLLGEAQKMADWSAWKVGEVAGGWPRYPVAAFEDGATAASGVSGPVRVARPTRPIELSTALGLNRTTPDAAAAVGKPVLIWFNFDSSLGGEILAALIVRAFRRSAGLRFILAVDPRLLSFLSRQFPEDEVVAKTDDLRAACSGLRDYILARDVLSSVVRSSGDFAVVAAERFVVDPAPPPAGDGPHLAISWKTTNRRQGRYRNPPFSNVLELLSGLDAQIHSAQHGVTAAEQSAMEALGSSVRFDTIDPSGSIEDMASRLAAMDAVLTIDNTVLHLAGAIGVPTVALLSVPSYWAWPGSGEDSRWYPSVRLVHQAKPGSWSHPVALARALIERMLEGRRG